jgi:hypothetical protein
MEQVYMGHIVDHAADLATLAKGPLAGMTK